MLQQRSNTHHLTARPQPSPPKPGAETHHIAAFFIKLTKEVHVPVGFELVLDESARSQEIEGVLWVMVIKK